MFALSRKLYNHAPNFPAVKLATAMFSKATKYAYQVAINIKLPVENLRTDHFANRIHESCMDFLILLEGDYPEYTVIQARVKDHIYDITYKMTYSTTSYVGGLSSLSSVREFAIKMVGQKASNLSPIPPMMNMIIDMQRKDGLPIHDLATELQKSFADFQLDLQQVYFRRDITAAMEIIEPALAGDCTHE